MNIQKINLYTSANSYYNNLQSNKNKYNATTAANDLKKDAFDNSKAANAISFTARATFINREFENRFPRAFFKKLLRENIPDAYTGVPLVSMESIDSLKSLKVLNQKSAVAMPYLKIYKNNLFPIEKEVFSILEHLSKKHPNLTIQELLQIRYDNAEEKLIKQQTTILNKINMKIRNLPQEEYKNIRKLIQESFDKIFEKNPDIENRFYRQDFLRKLKRIPITDKNTKEKILEIAEKLPQSSDSLNAFIVKYSQPYKLTQSGKKVRRTSEDIAIRLLQPSLATDDHIYPQTLFKKDALTTRKGHKPTNPLRVTILTSKKINELKSDTLIDDFIKVSEYDIATHIDRHIQKLVFIAEKWAKNGRLQDAVQLADYITILKNEFHLRSSKIKIDISDFEAKIPVLKDRLLYSQAKQLEKLNRPKTKHKK